VNNIINQAAASRTLNPGPADPAVLGAPGRLRLHPSPVAGRGLPASHKAPAPPALPGARERCAAAGAAGGNRGALELGREGHLARSHAGGRGRGAGRLCGRGRPTPPRPSRAAHTPLVAAACGQGRARAEAACCLIDPSPSVAWMN